MATKTKNRTYMYSQFFTRLGIDVVPWICQSSGLSTDTISRVSLFSTPPPPQYSSNLACACGLDLD